MCIRSESEHSLKKDFGFLMQFNRFGLIFDYPENWLVDTKDSADRYATVTVYSPEDAFWSLSAHAAGGTPLMLAKAVVEQMSAEYTDLDQEAVQENIGGRTLSGFDLNFYCLDLTNTAQVRTLETPTAIYLLFCQAEDREWVRVSHVFAAMTASFITALKAV